MSALLIDKIQAMTNKGLLRALSLLLALIIAGHIFWDPTRFAAQTSSLGIWQGVMLVWAVCTCLIHGVGFQPRYLLWRWLFIPLPAIITLTLGLFYVYTQVQ